MKTISPDRLQHLVESLSRPESYTSVYHRINHDVPMPSIGDLRKIVDLLLTIIFPGYYGRSDLKPTTMSYYIGSTLEIIYLMLSEQIKRGYCFSCDENPSNHCIDCEQLSREITNKFLDQLPTLRAKLASDVLAAYEGDPAAKNRGEAIFCYPSIKALSHYRIAHVLYGLDVSLIPRIITEMAHSATGIDIHPGAKIGEKFFIDHGTGTVIGETCIIGDNVRIYQGVTLGAKSFPMDDNGHPVKGIPRHPIVEDDVTIYAGATVLGRITIGKGSMIGGNVWLTHSISPGTRVMQSRVEESFQKGLGI